MSGSVPEDPRVLHLVYSGGIYGIERMLLGLLPRLTANDCAIALGCFGTRSSEGGAIGRAAEALGVESHYLGNDAQSAVSGAFGIARLVRSWRPDIVHTHGYKATILGGTVGGLARVARLATYHAEAAHAVGLQLQVGLETPVLRSLQAIAAVSEPIEQELIARGVPPSRVRVIHNGVVPVQVERDSENSHPTIAVVGRLVREKNVQMVLEAATSLRTRWPTLKVIVAGEGPYRTELERMVGDRALGEHVSFLGFTPDIATVLAQADVFAMPSQTEGMPLALLEAMSARVPVVASAVGSIPMVARHDQEALLVERGDQVALTEALAAVFSDSEAAQRRVEAASSRFQDAFTADGMARSYRELYDQVGLNRV